MSPSIHSVVGRVARGRFDLRPHCQFTSLNPPPLFLVISHAASLYIGASLFVLLVCPHSAIAYLLPSSCVSDSRQRNLSRGPLRRRRLRVAVARAGAVSRDGSGGLDGCGASPPSPPIGLHAPRCETSLGDVWVSRGGGPLSTRLPLREALAEVCAVRSSLRPGLVLGLRAHVIVGPYTAVARSPPPRSGSTPRSRTQALGGGRAAPAECPTTFLVDVRYTDAGVGRWACGTC